MSLLGGFPQLIFVVGLALVGLLLLRERPRILAGLWLVTLCFVPWWTGVDPHSAFSGLPNLFFPAIALVSLFAVVCLQPPVITRWTAVDWFVAALFLALLLPTLTGTGSKALSFQVLCVWVPAFYVGRSLGARVEARWLYSCVATIFSIVAVLAIAEFVMKYNPFNGFRLAAGPSYPLWSGSVFRGGELRVQSAFGQPIALGSSLALAIPLTLASGLAVRNKMIAVGLMLVATVLTFSRTGMLCAALGLGLSIVFLREGLTARVRAAAAAAVTVVAVTLVPLLTSTFDAAGSEATNSASYRAGLTSLIPDIQLIGLSPTAQHLSNGRLAFGNFHSIDSELILLGLTYGGLAVGVVILLLVLASLTVLANRATAPTIAIAAHIPSLLTVALITQYSALVFFVAGLAVATQTAAGRADRAGPVLDDQLQSEPVPPVGGGARAAARVLTAPSVTVR